MLGIGRARVFYHEQCAIKKLRNLLFAKGIQNVGEFEDTPSLALPPQRGGGHERGVVRGRHSPANGWLRVTRIMSVNDGSTEPLDVALAYRYLKERNEKLVRPPVLVCGEDGSEFQYVVQAADVHDEHLCLRCWPVNGRPRTVANIAVGRCTAIVESEFGTDAEGSFDVPILLCVLVSSRSEEG